MHAVGVSIILLTLNAIAKEPASKGVCINLSKSEHCFTYSPWLTLAKVKGQSIFREVLELRHVHGRYLELNSMVNGLRLEF